MGKIVDTASTAAPELDGDDSEDQPGARFQLTAEDGRVFSSNSPPILATGFKGNASVVANLFGWDDDTDYPTLTGNDESVKTPGLFLLGSQVRHQAKRTYGFSASYTSIERAFLWLREPSLSDSGKITNLWLTGKSTGCSGQS